MRLLVAEDETRMSAMLQRGLAEDGYSVDVPADGSEALWRATGVDYDVIVLDPMLPGIDGFEAPRREPVGAWADPHRPHRCGRPGPRARLRADDYLAKPFSFMELTHGCGR